MKNKELTVILREERRHHRPLRQIQLMVSVVVALVVVLLQ
jgi:hypothetical protein